MLRALLALSVLGCGSTAPPPVEPAPATPKRTEPPPAGGFEDPDGDKLLGACDVCPDQAERWNDWANDDGCPESDDEILAVTTHPTNQYSVPLFQIGFSEDGASAPVDRTWSLDDDIEAVACVASAPDLALAKKRVSALCKSLRASVASSKIQVLELETSQKQIYVDPDGRVRETAHGIGVIQVLRANGTEVWRWQGGQLFRVAKQRVVESRPLPDGCTWVSFQLDRATGNWSTCPDNECKLGSPSEGFRARWGMTPPVYPGR